MNTTASVIDINTVFGRRLDPDPRYAPDALAEELDRHQVALAFTCSRRGVEYAPGPGNRETEEAGRRHPGLLPAAVLDPRDTFGWTAEADRCLAAGIRLFRFFPKPQRWLIDSACFRAVLRHLGNRRAVVLIEASDWDSAEAVARASAPFTLPVILAETHYGVGPDIIALMRLHPHLYADTSFLATVDAVRILADAVGYRRLLYGSAAPWHPMQKALNQVLEADLPPAHTRAILGGNARRLLGIPAARLAGRPVLPSLVPLAFDEPVIDIHSHLGLWPLPARQEDHDPAGLLARMRRFGITHSVLSSYETMRYDLAGGNRALAGALAGHSELRGMVELDPRQHDLSCAEMDRYYARSDFAACEVELSHLGWPTGSPETKKLFGAIARRGKPVLFMPRNGDGDVAAEIELARAHPRLTLVHAHGADPAWARAVREVPNLCVEYCYSRTTHHRIREGIDILGPERVLFGSDQTLLSPAGQLGLYRDARLTARERRLILHDNARRLYGIR